MDINYTQLAVEKKQDFVVAGLDVDVDDLETHILS